MANRYWRGVNTTWGDTANWSATRTGATGQSVPSGTDTVYILDGDGDIASVTGVTAASITIGGNFTGNINGLTIATTTCAVTVETVALGKAVNIGVDASVTNSVTWHIKSTGAGRVTLIGGASSVLSEVRCGGSGTCIVDGGLAITTFSTEGMYISAMTNATAFTTLTIDGGQGHDIQRAATTLNVQGGATAKGINSVAYTTLNIGYLSTYTHDSDGTIGTLNAYRGSTLLPLSTPFTITNTNLREGANISRNSDKITFTNAPALYGNVA